MRLPLRRLISTLTHHPTTSDRELALPLAFLSSQKWSGEAASKWSPWISRFNALGYSCMSIDVDCATKRLEDFEEELKKQLRQSGSPFPPLLFAQGYNTLIAQTYVSSHPLSGLILVDPPMTVADALKSCRDLVEGSTQEFDYEPFFPIALVGSRSRAEELEQHRLRKEFSEEVHLLVTPDEQIIGSDSFEWVGYRTSSSTLLTSINRRVKDWMDSNGL